MMQQLMLRRATMIIGSSNFGGKAVAGKMDRLWPIPKKQERKGVSERALETVRRIREQDALLKAKQEIDARRTKT